MTNAEARCNKSLRPRKPEGSLGRTAQDVHLDSHTAPELWRHSFCALFFYQHILYHVLDYPGRTWLSVYKQRASETHIFHSFSWCLKRYFPPCWLALSLKHFFCFFRSNAFKSCWHSRFNRTSLLAIIAHFPASRHFLFVGSDYFGNSGMRSRGVSRSLSINTL